MIDVSVTSKNGVILATSGKYCEENVNVTLANSSNILAENIKEGVQILDVIGTLSGGGGESNGLHFNEFSAVTSVNLNGTPVNISLDCDDVDWLIMFPLQGSGASQYACGGGLYMKDVFGMLSRTSYGTSAFSSLGASYGGEMIVENGVLTISKSQNCYVNGGDLYGIVYKEKSN